MRAIQEIVISQPNTTIKVDLRLPAEGEQARAVHQLARRAVGLGGVPNDLTLKTEHALNNSSKVANRNITAVADVDELFLRIVAHEEYAGAREVIDIQKLTQGRTG